MLLYNFRMNTYLIDFEGYPQKNKFIIKELSLYEITNKKYENFFIKTNQIKNCETYLWLLKKFHQIPYTYGETLFTDLKKKLNSPNIIYFVKGENKLKILKKIIKKNLVINLEEYGCPPYTWLSDPSILLKCEYHNNCRHCALYKISKIANWLENENKNRGTLV